MNPFNSNSSSTLGTKVEDRYSQGAATYLSKVSGWMFAGLGITALVALLFDKFVGFGQAFEGNMPLLIGLIVAELGLVVFLSFKAQKLSGPVAGGLFFLYAALNGITLSGIFQVYTDTSIVSTFFIAAGMFGALGAFGFLTKKDLSPWGAALFVALIGLILASIVGIFLHSEALQILISIGGVLIFSGLTAYDFNRIKQSGEYHQSEGAAVLDALTLYLDFINLFLYLLRLFGSSD